ncbi:MAG: Ig-like domain-containing protein [Bacteroidota bacterium]
MLSKNHAGPTPGKIRVFNYLAKAFILFSILSISFIGAELPAPQVVLELRCDEGAGTTTADASGNGYNGTLTNGPTWGAGKYGQGINVDGTNDYISIADNANFTLTPTVSYSWSGWVKNNNFNPWGTIWSQTVSTTNYFYFYAHTSTDAEAGPVTNGVSVYWYSGSSKLVIHSNNNVLTAGQWSYIAVTYNAGVAQNLRFTIYVNGADVTNRTDVVSSGTIAAIDPTNIRIGANQPYGDYLNGSVDEIRYYRRLLSIAEIQSDMVIGNAPDTQLPVVNLTAPSAGNVSGTINISANASDNVGVAGVQFLLDGVNIGTEDITAPYSVSWNTTTATNGSHILMARARDAAGNISTSAVIAVNVSNDSQSPTVNITVPSAGNVSGTINVTANAIDNVGVAGVQFLLDGVNIGTEDITAPYSVSWNTTTATNGSHSLTARARDAAGNSITSAAVVVNVNNIDAVLPTVTITAPSAGNVSGTINVTANATDNVGVAGVQFLLDGVNIGTEDITAPYSVSWNTTTATNGSHSLTARARDAAGNATTSAGIAVTVNNDVTPPAVTVTPPVTSPVTGTLTINATASDNVGVAGIQFLLDGVNLGTEDLTAPYSVSWATTATTNGVHTLTARARDAAGNSATSAGVPVTVFNNNLVAAYGFNENTGTSANDNSGNNNTGTLTNGPVWSASGRYGAAILFDGTNDLVNINDANSLDLTGGMTLEAWVNASNLSGYKTVLCKENGTNNLSYALSANNSTSGTANQRPDSRIRIGTTTRTVTGTTKLTLNTWTHIASTYDGATMRLYINGVQVSSFATTGNITTTTNALRIGGSTALGTQYFAGLIDEVRIYNKALTQAEIQTDMNTPVAPDVTAPTVSVTAPAAGNVSGTINVTASANDNIGVIGVQFLLDGINVGAEDVTAPYAVSWNTGTATNGTHTLTARARDAAGNITISPGVIVTVSNDTQQPTVTLTAPAAGTIDGTVNVSADATDNIGVTGVQFLLNGNSIGAEDLAAPYSIAWNTTTVTDGNYTLTARARDAAGNTMTSSPVMVNVLNHPPDTESPTVTMTAPAAGEVAGTINVTANANDNVGVAGVQFLLNGVNLGAEDATAPYAVSWNTLTVANGTYTLTARARDQAGNNTTSQVVVTVNNPPDTESPAVSITAPSAGNVIGTISVTATATDNLGVVGVQFLLDGISLGAEDLTAPYSIAWNTLNTANGSHILTARARDQAGNSRTSLEVAVTVSNDITSPAVSITAPATGTVSGTISITANANDNVGVAGVQFKLNGANIGAEDISSPYSYSWNTLTTANGSYTLTAVARDAAGNTMISAGVVVTVSNAANLIAALPFNEGTGTTAADISGNNHTGTLTSGPAWTTGKYGQGITLDGTNDYVNIADHANFTLTPTISYSWSGWLKSNNFNQWGTIWSQTTDASNYFYFYAHSTSDADAGPVTNGISVYWKTGGTNKLVIHSNNNVLTAGQWSHVAITYNASLAQNSRFTIYVNGVDVTNRTDIVSTGTLAAINPTNIRMGSNQPWGEYINASIDEVRYYNRLLTAAEVVTDMNTPIGVIDNTAPAVSITSPGAGNVSGSITITANATDNISVAGVQFLLDGVNLGAEDITVPYSVSWNTTTATGGVHILTAIARDAAGNTATAAAVNVTVTPDFSFTALSASQSIAMTGSTDFGVSVIYLNDFTSNDVALSVTGLPAGVTGNYIVNPLTNQGQTQLHITSGNATPGTYTLTLSATAQGITHTQQVTLIVNGAADFTLSASPAVQNVTAGNGTSYTITISETGGDFLSPATLSVLGLPAGAAASFNPSAPVPAATSVLTITTSASTPNGTYSLTVRGISGSLTHTTPVTLTVSSTPALTWPVTNIGSGWDLPMGAVFSKDGQKLFVWEKGGKVFVCNRNTTTQVYEKQITPVIDLSAEVGNWGDHGLNGFALDPNFNTNGLIYLLYLVDKRFLMNDATPVDQGSVASIGRVTRYQTINSGGNLSTDLTTRTILLGETKSTGICVLYDSHGLGSLVFASDGTLLVSAGDGGTYNGTDVGSNGLTYYQQAISEGLMSEYENVGAFRAQLLNSHNGKILRIDPTNGNGLTSNPFYDAAQPRSPKSRVWALGFRNPFRFTIRPGTGSANPSAGDIGEIYVGDVGWRTYEELNIIKAPGMNCGWPYF